MEVGATPAGPIRFSSQKSGLGTEMMRDHGGEGRVVVMEVGTPNRGRAWAFGKPWNSQSRSVNAEDRAESSTGGGEATRPWGMGKEVSAPEVPRQAP